MNITCAIPPVQQQQQLGANSSTLAYAVDDGLGLLNAITALQYFDSPDAALQGQSPSSVFLRQHVTIGPERIEFSVDDRRGRQSF